MKLTIRKSRASQMLMNNPSSVPVRYYQEPFGFKPILSQLSVCTMYIVSYKLTVTVGAAVPKRAAIIRSRRRARHFADFCCSLFCKNK